MPQLSGDAGAEDVLCDNAGLGDNIIRLVNPNGSANPAVSKPASQSVCAMIYVFDDDEEMGECCGCPLSAAKLATFSVNNNLTSNWSLPLSEVGAAFSDDNALGAIAIVAAVPNRVPLSPNDTDPVSLCSLSTPGSDACFGGCDPAAIPGYSVTTVNLLGSITHNQGILGPMGTNFPSVVLGITETELSDDAGSDPTNLIYLQAQCGALVGNSNGSGICNCPVE